MKNCVRIVTPPIRYQKAGYCIYCGDRSAGLSEEHILPYGLAGDCLVLPKSSCAKCQSSTGKAEIICLRHLWWPFRTRTGMPSRTAAPEAFSLKRMKVEEYDPIEDKIVSYVQLGMDDLKPEQYPLFYQTFEFPSPGILAGRSSSQDTGYQLWCKIDEVEFRKTGSRDKEGFRLSPGAPEAFCRMLAKIAHSYAAANLRGEQFDPLLDKYIQGESLDRLQLIDCSGAPTTSKTTLHRISMSKEVIHGEIYVVVAVQLFACLGTPTHLVVVGKLIRSTGQVEGKSNVESVIEIEGTLPFQESEILRGLAAGGWGP
jgi:hypothetical protein